MVLRKQAPIGAWKCNFPASQEIMTDRTTNQPIDGHEGSKLLFLYKYRLTIFDKSALLKILLKCYE